MTIPSISNKFEALRYLTYQAQKNRFPRVCVGSAHVMMIPCPCISNKFIGIYLTFQAQKKRKKIQFPRVFVGSVALFSKNAHVMMMIIVVFFHEKEASGHFNATSEIQTSSTHLCWTNNAKNP